MSSLLIHKIGNSFFHVDSELPEFPMFLGDFWVDIERDKFQLNRYAGSSGREYLFSDVTIQVDNGSIETFTTKDGLTNRLKEISYPGVKNFSSGGATPTLSQVLLQGDRTTKSIGGDPTYSFIVSDKAKHIVSDGDCIYTLDGSLAFTQNTVLKFSNPLGKMTLAVSNGSVVYKSGEVIVDPVIIGSNCKGILTCTDSAANTWVLTVEVDRVEPRKYRALLSQENTVISSGTIEVGKRYIIYQYNAGDDFTNVGGSNSANTDFIATDTTPTDWTNGSVLIDVALSLPTEFQRRENTMGFEPDWQYTPYGTYGFPMTGIDLNKVDCFIGGSKINSTSFFRTAINQDFDFNLYSYSFDGLGGIVYQDGLLFRTELTIIINP